MKKLLFLVTVWSFLCVAVAGCVKHGDEDVRDYRTEMRSFVQRISSYARSHHSNFIVIPQNGQELLTENGEEDGAKATAYIAAIDGTGREDLFYGYDEDNVPTPAAESEYMVAFLDIAEDEHIEALVTDYCWTPSYVDDSYSRNEMHGYISFAAHRRELDSIPIHPLSPHNENTSNIHALSDARNFLYLIDPALFADKTDFLNSLASTNYDLLIIDLFVDGEALLPQDVSSLKIKENHADRLVIAYMSIGEAEDYRYYWNPQWETAPPEWMEEENPDWPGNFRVQYWHPDWQAIVFGNDSSYCKRIIDAGFDGIYLDIIDAFEYFESR